MRWLRGNRKADPDRPWERRFAKSAHLADLLDAETGWYKGDYFTVRLSDEVTNAIKNKRHLALVCFHLPLGTEGPTNHLRVYLTIRLGLLEHELTAGDGFSGRLGDDEFAICIPDIGASGAAEMLGMLWSTLSALGADALMLTCPEDGTDATTLLETARAKLMPSNVLDLAEYRKHRYGKAA